MDHPTKPPAGLVQPSIRSFFQPRQPTYATPPAATSDAPPRQQEDQDTETKKVNNKNNNNIAAADATTTTTTTTNNNPPAISKPSAPIPQPPPLPPPKPAASAPLRPPTLPPLSSLPALPPPPSLHRQATIAPITAEHIPALRRINSILLPVIYPDSFYTTILTAPTTSHFSRAILWRDRPHTPAKVIGSIVCRLEPASASAPAPQAIYIQSLALLSAYRELGLAAAALESIVSTAVLLSSPPSPPDRADDDVIDIRSVYAHVWTQNTDGLRWYGARGFATEGRAPVAGYYTRLRPDTAWVVRREMLGARNGRTAAPGKPLPPPPPPSRAAGEDEEEEGVRGRTSVLAGVINLLGFGGPSPPPPPPPGVDVTAGSGQARPSQPPPPPPSSSRPRPPAAGLSYQKTRPETEWNDLPVEMVAGTKPGVGDAAAADPTIAAASRPTHLSAPASGTSSRSSSAGRRKKERAYPAAAFGS